MTKTLSAARTVKCPQCGGDSPWTPSNPWRPFCSERCKLIDLGAWANESYRVPVEENDDTLGTGPADDQ